MGGTLTAAVALGRQGPATDRTEARQVVAAAMKEVAADLGNTPAVARSSYVSPVVVERYLEGRTIEDFRLRRSLRRPYLTSDEHALLRLPVEALTSSTG